MDLVREWAYRAGEQVGLFPSKSDGLRGREEDVTYVILFNRELTQKVTAVACPQTSTALHLLRADPDIMGTARYHFSSAWTVSVCLKGPQ